MVPVRTRRETAGLAGPDFLQRNGLDELGVHLQQAGRGGAVEGRGQPDRHAVLAADQRAGGIRPRGQGRREPVHDLGSLGGRGAAPPSGVQGAPGGFDRGVDVGFGG